MAAVTFFLNQVAALTKGGTNLLRDAQIFPMGAHTFPSKRVTALAELLHLLGMSFPALFGGNCCFRFIGGLVVSMAGDAGHPIRSVFRSHPGLEERRGSFYVAAHTESWIDPFIGFFGGRTRAGNQ